MDQLNILSYRSRQTLSEPNDDGQIVAPFDVFDVITEQDLTSQSVNFSTLARSRMEVDDYDRALQLVVALRQGSVINNEQMGQGARSGVLILQGLPGTGKSKTLAYIIITLMCFGFRVVATAHSNFRVNKIFNMVW